MRILPRISSVKFFLITLIAVVLSHNVFAINVLVFTKTAGILITALVPLLGWILIGILTDAQSSTIHITLSEYIPYFAFFYSAWLLCSWMMFAYMLTDHYLDVWVVTDRRIISINQKGLFQREIGSFRLEKLQDINISINGIIATFLNFGMVEAQTASGSEEEFQSFHLPQPQELKAIILKAADGRMKQQTATEQNAA